MSISLDHDRAKEILFEEAAAARRYDSTGLVAEWASRVRALGALCPHGRSATVIAALGTALLAKATNDGVDIYALLDRGEAPGSYSARSLADNVWARHRGELEIDLGANGANPLNNTPFIGKTRIDEITGVRNQPGWDCFIECLEAVKELPSSQAAREALRGFIMARSRALLPARDTDSALGDDLGPGALVAAITLFVAEDSEGGRRAQATVAAMLDAAFGADRVLVGVINDPDRHAPLDVSVTDGAGGFTIAFEVKDKPVVDFHVRSAIEKTVKDHGLRNLAFVAVSAQHEQTNFDEVIRWAATRGVKITVLLDWQSLYQACKCFAPATGQVFEGDVYRSLHVRARQLGVSGEALDRLRALAAARGRT